MKRKALYTVAACGVFLLFLAAALDTRLRMVTYEISTEKLEQEIRLAVLADLHSCAYGEDQRELLDAVKAQSPDAVLLAGDIVDDMLPEENAWTAISALAADYPCFYVTGNHEWWAGETERICRTMEQYGVIPLRGASMCFSTANGQVIRIGGVDDPESGALDAQLAQVGETLDENMFTILMAHRPEGIETYRQYAFDLIVSGHAHGGQWRIPVFLNGLYAPGQGFFPTYAGGRYDMNDTTLVVSRGLARESTKVPRIFNRPELVLIQLTPIS
ncbi:hypothetical protein SAMN05216343_11334 [Oscillibacter sp. PC13]|uniref:metallophosphoesterase n=1 Tax=Oscillibacter sp. PC13 TaxID=1855299 RepID=UPI0008E43235|nr:metallophosphoesterase [Oscillibacter sp. PC13]SFP73487.1 hypothetical protein SAMN05216343_11334 [Oscillibacter sp. PC13]